ncbi:phosphonate metabolism protein/1,5-bisphosphokinase (PRPP-forming) PhnN [Lutimaribacter marinistellae]|uniref:Ribose 1,5-bisphosphate phosphokinase PhnN n=1 Tax=Lutimaribacter marinistellae TaxID=1820329 RepID=A0ABV7TGI8_9RHOB
MNPAPVIAVVGPSGVGKDSVMAALAARDPRIRLVRRVITRRSEAGGEPFEGVSEEEFARRIAAGSFVLHWSAHGLRYGIPAAITDLRRDARAVLVNLSRSVLAEAEHAFGNFAVISLTARPELLAARLAARGREDEAQRTQRLSRAALSLPDGLSRVIEIDNSGSLDDTVDAILSQLQPERA